ncbi:MAG TPA: hypothetical protein VG937_34165 [Polyangiaceae bacterium]|nr:hypothetical protein [Polyangiaceae bacterium]
MSANATAHPGHGMPGWIHPHVADYALIGFGIFVLAMGLYFLRKALKK